ncbi:MAG: ATP-binding cassette domain-containing protein [Paludibacter sp.]|nr:ATP-binding cassette domain-containing protein [Paludibacter sp.]
MSQHIGLYLSNTSNKKLILKEILHNNFLNDYINIDALKGVLFSFITIEKMISEEFLHDKFIITTDENSSLSTMSSGQQRKALLAWQIAQKPEYMLLDDVYANVDKSTQEYIKTKLGEIAPKTQMIQVFFRRRDMLPFIDTVLTIDGNNKIMNAENSADFQKESYTGHEHKFYLPENFGATYANIDPLIELRNVSVKYEEKQVLTDVNWSIRQGEFWQMTGPNGSGKSTLVSMISGDNPKAYGQDMILFGRKKGSGETIWDIKKQIGYFTPLMIQRFTRTDSVENMIISGLNDSVGLYVEPTDLQKKVARNWLEMLGPTFRNKTFQQLTTGQKRMVMVARAMVKYPPLLILDEPTIELDDENSRLFIDMVNAIAFEKKVAIIYVSHRDEENLRPDKIYELVKTEKGGYTGRIV